MAGATCVDIQAASWRWVLFRVLRGSRANFVPGIVLIKEIPKNASGKILKRKLRELEQGHSWTDARL